MKKLLPILSRAIVLVYSVLTVIFIAKIHQWAATEYKLTLEMLFDSLIVVFGGVLFSISIFKFTIVSKANRIILFCLVAVTAVISILLLKTYSLSYTSLFVSAAYCIESLLPKKKN